MRLKRVLGSRPGIATLSRLSERDGMRKRSLKVALAQANRHEPTAAEQAAWALLRNRRCLGLKFRRQHVVRGFIVDFYCAELRLAVEVDGTVHCGRTHAEYDAARSRALAHAGIEVVRIRNEQVSETGLVTLLEPYVTASPSPATSPPVPLSACGEGERNAESLPLSTNVERGSGGEAKRGSGVRLRGGRGVRLTNCRGGRG